MTHTVNDQEFASVLALPPNRRYAYFIKRVADREELWSLRDESGWLLADDDQGHGLVPVWPYPRFAEACATGDWSRGKPASIGLTAWLERWLPGMTADHRLIAVFPTPSGKGVTVTPERLKTDLESLIEELYGEE